MSYSRLNPNFGPLGRDSWYDNCDEGSDYIYFITYTVSTITTITATITHMDQ